MTSSRPLLAVTVGCFVAGSAIMLAFEAPVARIAGVALLFGFIVAGVFLVADAAALERGDDGA